VGKLRHRNRFRYICAGQNGAARRALIGFGISRMSRTAV
jgi:hypothetical protein